MSRESDTTSSGPQGHGGAASYPSGTPPYGTRRYPSLHPPQDAPDAPEAADAGRPSEPEEQPKTETTLTTRIRINIPGSRPIPPVVMRTPVEDRSSATEPGVPGPAGPAEERRPSASASAAGGGREGAGKNPPAPGGQGGGERASDWFAPRKTPTPTSGTPIPGGPAAGGPGGAGAGSGGAAPGGGPAAPGGRPAGGPPPGRDADPTSTPAYGTRVGPVPGAGPNGPTGGPAEGDMPLLPPAFRQQAGGQGGQGGPGAPAGGPGGPAGGDGAPRSAPPSPAYGGFPPPAAPGPMQDPAAPAPAPFGADHGFAADPAFGGPEEPVSSDTLVSGIQAVPPAGESPFPTLPADDTGAPRPPAPPGSASPAPAARKKGRSKLVLAGAAVVAALGVAYAAGLLLDHAEVPKGTTVAGVDIGGISRQEAVNRLDQGLGRRVDAPMTVRVAGEQHELKPSVVGLDVDVDASVRQAAGRDYNPVSVIGSLFGGSREAEAEIVTDREKLRAALESLAGESGAEQDGMIRFEAGKAVPVPGKPHRAVDVNKSVTALSDAYRARTETGASAAVELPSTVRQPAVDQAEIDKAMKEFAEPAMSGLVTVRTDPARTISFSPENSLPKFLSMKAVNGKLVDTYDLKVLKSLYGGVFDGVLIERGNGSKTPVSPQDVAGALREALRSTDPAGRTVTIDTTP
ncbi:hypothetical protein [Streptomyces xinghaiensis]|uniref:hypothetical protein n=1 Tax=Streptomyces xinghaiensis TaxID=1038928 RepID=UPI002E1575F7|nr:hypothetical protein OG463_19460 [Streptomyces xinghaiensis]